MKLRFIYFCLTLCLSADLMAAFSPLESCRIAHKKGYTALYDYLAQKPFLAKSLYWSPHTDLHISEDQLFQLNEDIIQHKNPITALITKFGADKYMKQVERELSFDFPRLSHFVINLAVKAKLNPPHKLKQLEAGRLGGGKGNGLLDARRHIIWSSLLARYTGPTVALCMLALHEVDDEDTSSLEIFKGKSKVAKNSRLMDFYNNALGVQLGLNFKGTDSEMIRYINRRVYSGEFVILGEDSELDFPFK